MAFDHARAAIFDELAPEWDNHVKAPDREALQELVDLLDIDGLVVLDIGAGTGVLLQAVEDRAPARWIACDISKRMLEILQNKYQGKIKGLEILVADSQDLPLDDQSVDRVVCNGVFPHFADKAAALLEIYRVLKPGGLLVINHFAGRDKINQIHGSSSNEVLRSDLLMTMDELRSLLQSTGFEVLSTVDSDELCRAVVKRP